MAVLTEAQMIENAKDNKRKEAAAEAAERAAQNPRPLIVDDPSVQRRNDIAEELLSFYEYLVSRYLPDEALKRPPTEGWAFINAERFAFLGKSDAVIDLYKHIPYIRQDGSGNQGNFQIDVKCVCLDYTGEYFKRKPLRNQNGDLGPDKFYETMRGQPTWERLSDPQHITILAQPSVSDGHFVVVDTRDGRTAGVYPRDYEESVSTVEYDSLKEYLDEVRQHLEELSILPLSPTEVVAAANSFLSARDTERIQRLYREH